MHVRCVLPVDAPQRLHSGVREEAHVLHRHASAGQPRHGGVPTTGERLVGLTWSEVGDPLVGNPFVHCPNFSPEVRGADLLAQNAVRQELGGAGLFLAVERLVDAATRRDAPATRRRTAQRSPARSGWR